MDIHNHSTFDADMAAYIKNGITTIRFTGLNQDAVVTLRGRVESGEIPGPRIFSCGPMLDKTPPAYPLWTSPVNTPAEAAATARRLLEVDQVDALLVTQQIAPDLLAPIVEAAHEHGRPLVGQIWFTDGREAAELGIDELDNSSRIFVSREYPKERLLAYGSIAERLGLFARGWATVDWDLTEPIIAAMVEHGVSYCPTLVVSQQQSGAGIAALQADPDYLTEFGEQEYPGWQSFMDYMSGTFDDEDRDYMRRGEIQRFEWMRRFHKAGGRLVVGGDMQFGGIAIHTELRNLEQAGLTPLEVLTAATGESADELGKADDLGTVQTGKLADLVLLSRDPLQDLGATRDIKAVIKGGVVVREG